MAPASKDQVTPEKLYLNRRAFMRTGLRAGGLVVSAAATGYLYRKFNGVEQSALVTDRVEGLVGAGANVAAGASVDSTVDALTPLASVINYNNFYEFTTNKDEVAKFAQGFTTDGWTVEIDGLCNKPKTFTLDEILKISPPEERIYRMRCVEAWSMVIPWVGYSLSKLLAKVEPQSSAKYVAFQTLLDPTRMPGQKSNALQWPYVEGLRIDEAMHPLAILASGLYGHALPAQDGAPLRLVTPWKYGFKGIKSIVKMSLVEKQPPTSWSRSAPSEYGFLANVNPEVAHPRWSQATEQRIGESGDQVASLYSGLDLNSNF
jgi:methionine sulfoxide reductase catalytic subunit